MRADDLTHAHTHNMLHKLRLIVYIYNTTHTPKTQDKMDELREEVEHGPVFVNEDGCVIIAIDIEARGPGPRSHGIISIGVCVGSYPKEEVIEKCRFDILPMEQDGQKFEPRCFDEFWSKHKDLLKKLTCDAKSASEQMAAFRKLIDKYPNAYIVCDNPGFDFGIINYYLDVHQLPTLNYDSNGHYRNTHDSDSYARGKMIYQIDRQWFDNAVAIDKRQPSLDALQKHMPEDDAEIVYRLHVLVMQW